MSEFNSIDDFLSHRSSERGGGARFLKGWKKLGKIDLWFHTRRLPLAIWQHRFPKLIVREDRETKHVEKFYMGVTLNCFEDETVLKKQWARNADGSREFPPKRCPICKLIEHVHQMLDRGEIALADDIFRFEGASDPKKNITLHAGGMTGLFTDKLSDEDKAALKKRGIYMSEAWAENSKAKLAYIFCVVDNAHPELGVQIATEPGLVGDKVKSVIGDMMASKGDELGNPMVNPYCIQVRYNSDQGVAFDKKYHALPIERHRLTDQIEALIRAEPPDLSEWTKPFNAQSLRAVMEEHTLVEFPFDEIFAGVGEYEEESDGEGDRDDAREVQQRVAKNVVQNAPIVQRRAAEPKLQVKSEPVVAMVPCDKCGAMMREDAAMCDKCGQTYQFDDAEPVAAKPAAPKSLGKASGAKLPF